MNKPKTRKQSEAKKRRKNAKVETPNLEAAAAAQDADDAEDGSDADSESEEDCVENQSVVSGRQSDTESENEPDDTNLNWESCPCDPVPTIHKRFQGQVPVDISTLKPEFTQKDCGSQVRKLKNDFNESSSVADYFGLFFTDSILEQFCVNTNSYGLKKNTDNWRILEIDELKLFFAIQFMLGLIKIPSRRYAWSKNDFYWNPWITERMSRNRFEAILSNLHWLDSLNVTPQQRSKKNKENSFWSVQSLLDQLAASCRRYYVPYQDIDIDEQCFGFKGRHSARCFNPNKPAKYHFKNYCLNCSLTCYTWNFQMYRGKDEERPAGMPATEFPCYVLTDYDILQMKGYILFCDNWYTTIALIIRMLVIGIFSWVRYEPTRRTCHAAISSPSLAKAKRRGDSWPSTRRCLLSLRRLTAMSLMSKNRYICSAGKTVSRSTPSPPGLPMRHKRRGT